MWTSLSILHFLHDALKIKLELPKFHHGEVFIHVSLHDLIHQGFLHMKGSLIFFQERIKTSSLWTWLNQRCACTSFLASVYTPRCIHWICGIHGKQNFGVFHLQLEEINRLINECMCNLACTQISPRALSVVLPYHFQTLWGYTKYLPVIARDKNDYLQGYFCWSEGCQPSKIQKIFLCWTLFFGNSIFG